MNTEDAVARLKMLFAYDPRLMGRLVAGLCALPPQDRSRVFEHWSMLLRDTPADAERSFLEQTLQLGKRVCL